MSERNSFPISSKSSYFLLLLVFFFLGGCAGSQARYTSNVVEFLYPGKDKEPAKEQAVEKTPLTPFSIPFKAGIAFVPDASSTVAGGPRRALLLSEKQKADLMERISTSMRKYPFIKAVELIPSQYLTAKGGFVNLDQIRSMYGIDVIALLSYDQVQHTDEGALSIMYWTLVGAYVIEGEKNDTSTMVDAAVFHIPDRRMLFRSAGTSHVSAKSTPVNLSEQLRKDSYSGFEKAVDGLVANLQEQFELFKANAGKPTQEDKGIK